MAEISIRFVASPGVDRTFTVGNDVVGNVMKMEGLGSGGGGGSGTTFAGGGGSGGCYARRNAQAVAPGDVLTIRVAPPASSASGSPGVVSTVIRSGATLLSARGGASGGNGSLTAGGTGATTFTGTFVGDVQHLGGSGTNGQLSNYGAGGGGAGSNENGKSGSGSTPGGATPEFGGASTTTGTGFYGSAWSGIATVLQRYIGTQGIVVLTYSTGVGQTRPTSVFSRLATLFRVANNSTINTSIFNRAVTIRRAFSNMVSLVSNETKQVQLPRSATASPTAQRAIKDVMLRKVATVANTPFVQKALTLGAKVATTVNQSFFARAVTIRRTFSAVTRPVGKLFLFLEARLIPREGGGGTVTNVFRNLFLFDD